MKVPEKIKVTITADGRKTPGMFVLLNFPMSRKNDYSLLFGPSDFKGEFEVTKEQILKEARKSHDLFLMDFVNFETFWTGKISATPMNREALRRALSAYQLFTDYDFPPSYAEQLQASDILLENASNAELSVSLECESEEHIEVETHCVRAS